MKTSLSADDMVDRISRWYDLEKESEYLAAKLSLEKEGFDEGQILFITSEGLYRSRYRQARREEWNKFKKAAPSAIIFFLLGLYLGYCLFF
ncbi:MAG: hypothetical protein LV480_02985 [Methylacidiphilales bacterium]|nr:hypothetical protein [Candidatus Methylacidiphilales bacterium]